MARPIRTSVCAAALTAVSGVAHADMISVNMAAGNFGGWQYHN